MDVLDPFGDQRSALPPLPRRRWAAVGATVGHRLMAGLVLAGSSAVPGWWRGPVPWDECWAGGWDGLWDPTARPAPDLPDDLAAW
ncbi:hypothetical protein ACI79C_21970 [Geodermatophilus sp. SYSU D00697]